MRSNLAKSLLATCTSVLLITCGAPAPDEAIERASTAPAQRVVNASSIIEADATPGQWLTHGRTYSEQRFSPLIQISEENVTDLGLAWYFDLPTRRGVEATPLVADGKLYATGPWGYVFALDAKTGQLLWQYDPEVPREYGVNACCDVVNRGVALWGDKVYVGSLDGRLIALERETGRTSWEVDTRINLEDPYTITGAPRIVNGKIIIGNGGAELGVRGYVTAYDAETGKQLWRFYTVPGNPADGFEDETQRWIATTWSGEWWNNGKGGGTAWDSFAFDPELNLLYIGVGNGSSWNQKIRSPGGGDNLFLSSIVAVDADSGKYAWHYQTTPGDTWDYTATQHMILADMEINGQLRKVIMQAPKNGFFYVIDRATGELLSARNYVDITWASHVDMNSGRPVEAPQARSGSKDVIIYPGPSGAHNWHPMSFSPETGLVYIPAKTSYAPYEDDFYAQRRPTRWNTNYSANMVVLPDELSTQERATLAAEGGPAFLLAWDPAKNQEVWRKRQGFYSGGGLLSTKGNLLFQGDLEGRFYALAADSGEERWSTPVQGGIMAAPVTYLVDGEQYIAVMQGWGGETGLPFGAIAGPRNMVNISRVLVFKLGGEASLPKVELVEQILPAHNLQAGDVDKMEEGRARYGDYCLVCHGGNAISSGLIPDLRYRIGKLDVAWQDIVIGGALRANGMPAWGEYLSREEADAIKAYVIHEATLGHARGEKRLVKK